MVKSVYQILVNLMHACVVENCRSDYFHAHEDRQNKFLYPFTVHACTHKKMAMKSSILVLAYMYIV